MISRFKKGQSGNPKGRPKGSRSFKDALKKVLEADTVQIKLLVNGEQTKEAIIKIDTENSCVTNFYDAIAAIQVQQAMKGNQRAVKDIIDRMEGSASQSIKMQSEVSGNLSVSINKRVINSKSEVSRRTVTKEDDGSETVTTKTETKFDLDEVI